MKQGHLLLANGQRFEGAMPLWSKPCSGEVVFTTGMCGYYESLTDPSYAGQILTFTYPLIGNYGVPPSDHWESKKIQVRGVILNESCVGWSHHRGVESLLEWLQREEVPVLTGVDTRALTKQLRSCGTLLGVLSDATSPTLPFEDPNQLDLVSLVSPTQPHVHGQGKARVIAVDCGMKQSLLKQLCALPIQVVQVPFDYDYTHEPYDGVFYSNGPGDPSRCEKTIAILRTAMSQKKPIYGVCLGSQMLALAAGAKTFKLPFGHRGQNQPCLQLETGKCFITSQNHGYAVDEKSLPSGWRVTFRNLNDGSVEGIAHETLPFSAVQFHPEAKPGPTDTQWFFERFYQCLQS